MVHAESPLLAWSRISRCLVVAAVLVGGATTFAQSSTGAALDRGSTQSLDGERAAIRGLLPTTDTYNIVLVTLDALRPDAIGAFGGKKDATPNLDALATNAFRFTKAYAVSDHRLGGLMCFLYGVYPSTLTGISDLSRLPSAAAHFADRGFMVNANLPGRTIDLDGFRVSKVKDSGELGFPRPSHATIPDQVVTWFERVVTQPRDSQLFAWLHLSYTAGAANYHPGFTSGNTPREHYAAAVRCADHVLGRMAALLKTHKLAQNTIVVVAGVSGRPELEAKDIDPLSDDALRVPIIIFVPGLEGREIESPVETIDVVPTLLSVLDKSQPFTLQGRSALGFMLPRGVGAKAEKRFLYAEHEPTDSETADAARSTVSDGSHRVVISGIERNAAGVALPGGAAPEAALKPLIAAAEEMAVYSAMTVDLRRRDSADAQRAPELSGPEYELAHARWLLERGDKRGDEAVRKLVKTPNVDPLAVLDLVAQGKTKVENNAMLAYLDSRDFQVQALAGAYLAANGDAKRGVEYALKGLRAEMPPRRLMLLFDALSRSNAKEALVAIKKYDSGDSDRAVAAARRLALARLGDAESGARLVEHIVEPSAPYSKGPFIDLLLERKTPDAEAILRLCLTDGDDSPETTMLVLDALEKLDARGCERAVAAKLEHPNRSVRRRAQSLLQAWQSLAGYPNAVLLAKREEAEVGTLMRSYVAAPSLVGSPLLPGMRFSHFLAEPQATPPKVEQGLPVFGPEGLTFRVRVTQSEFRNVVVVFRRTGGAVPDVGSIRVAMNGKFAGGVELALRDGLYFWVGRVQPGTVELGQNQIVVRLMKVGNDPVEAQIAALFFVPLSDNPPVPIAAIDNSPVDPASERVTSQTLTFPRAPYVYRIAWAAAGSIPDSFAEVKVRLVAGDRTLAEIVLPRHDAADDVPITLPEGPWRLKDASLVLETPSGESQMVWAVLYAANP